MKKYQDVTALVTCNTNVVDPGAKYHVPGGLPYYGYFLAHIQQFEFQKRYVKFRVIHM